MSKADSADFLVEIGTEELPPKALPRLMHAFEDGLLKALAAERLGFTGSKAFASPRRLAVRVGKLARAQTDLDEELKGPPVSIAFDKDGKPTRAAEAFAKKCGTTVDALQRETSDKGEWLVHRSTRAGLAAAEVLASCVQRALDELPVPRRMRWGANSAEFVRPVHWVVMLHGDEPVVGEVLGIDAGRETRGHRFMAPGTISLDRPADYESKLETDGRVLADFARRRACISDAVAAAAAEAGGTAVGDAALYDEVCALTEWPVAVTGSFDAAYLELPREVIVATLTGHQRYFPVAGKDGELLPKFITVANIDSPRPGLVRDGNERVIRPRLADAAFFRESDGGTPLAERMPALDNVVYQRGLGSLLDRGKRIALVAGQVAKAIDGDPATAERAALLAKCDLLTGMVGEFPELQGIMGEYYARADGETAAVATAIGEQYLPRFAGDRLPGTTAGQALALADKLDALCGIFASGKKPSGNRDPFGLRRAALGLVRIVVEHRLELDLPALIDTAVKAQPVGADKDCAADVYDFIVERLRGWYLERDDITVEMFESVRARQLPSLCDFDARLAAVAGFVEHEAADSLAAANKRIANILRKAGDSAPGETDTRLLQDDAERALAGALADARKATGPLLDARDYAAVLARLAELRAPVDRFFDEVMVMSDDGKLRDNRLALLASLRAEFLKVADISRLSLARN